MPHLETLKSTCLFIAVFLVGTGCSGYRTQRAIAAPDASFAAPAAGLATICVFRPHGLGASVVAPVSDNGAIVGATANSSYFCYQAEPGPHRILTADAPKLVLNATEGKTYYLAHDLNVGRDALVRIKQGSAQALTAWCGPIELRAAPPGVAVLKRGQIARADLPRPLQARAEKPAAAQPAVATRAQR
jgi:hypothetical protein